MILTFGFLAIDTIKNEQIWIKFFNNLKKLGVNFNVVIHAKLDAFNFDFECIFVDTVNTSWERLVGAELILINKSVELGSDYFVLLSPNCLPIVSAQNFYGNLMEFNGKSIFPNSNPWFLHRKNIYNGVFNINYWGGHQWFISNRDLQIFIKENSNEILNITDTLNWVDCEFAIQTVVKEKYYNFNSRILNFPSTYNNFKFPERNGSSPRSLLEYFSFYDLSCLIEARKSKALFARKFSNLNKLKSYVYFRFINNQLSNFEISIIKNFAIIELLIIRLRKKYKLYII